MYAGETGSTTFEIWNNGTGQLDYTLSENCDWVTVSPESGSSSGEHDVITVSINTSGLSEGLHTCSVSISSNSGSGTFTVTVTIISAPPLPPSVEIIKPEKNILYLWDHPIIRVMRTFIIGSITVEANASDDDGYIWKVEFIIDNETKYTDFTEPYSWIWNELAFGRYVIKVRAYDNVGLTAEDEVNVTIFNLGLRSLEEKGVVKGKVTEAGKILGIGIPDVVVTASDGSNTTTGRIPLVNRGKYSLPLPPGIYDITFEAEGYASYTEEDVEVTAGDTIYVDVELEPIREGYE